MFQKKINRSVQTQFSSYYKIFTFYSNHRTRARQWCISLSLTVSGVVLWSNSAAPTVAPVKLFFSSKWSHVLHLPIFVITDSLALGHVHDDAIKWKHFPRYWPFLRGIHRSPVNSPHTGQWRGALVFSLICVWINGWVNNREAGDLRHYHAHYDVTVLCMITPLSKQK